MLIDTHIHTKRYSGCSNLDPVDIVRRAEELNLSGIILTEHDFVWTEGEIEELKRETLTGILILRAQEVSSPAGHVLVYGCDERLDHLETEELLEYVHQQGGAAVASHPFRYGDFAMDSFETLRKQLEIYDGFEVLTGNQTDDQNAFGMKAWETLGLTGLGGSDSHSLDMIGRFVTEFERDIQNEGDLIEEIMEGRCKPVVRQGADSIYDKIE